MHPPDLDNSSGDHNPKPSIRTDVGAERNGTEEPEIRTGSCGSTGVGCQCSQAGFCPVRQCKVNSLLWKKCQAGGFDAVSKLLDNAAKCDLSKHKVKTFTPPVRSNIGTRLHEIIKRETGNDVPCSACKAEIDRLNYMTGEQVLKQAVPLATSIVTRGASQAAKWYQRLAAKLAPSLTAQIVRSWIVEACGVQMMAPPVPVSEILVGSIHEGHVQQFQQWAKLSNIPIKLGNFDPHFARRILTTTQYEGLVREEMQRLNGGFDRITSETPWIADRWSYSVTTVPSRISLLEKTLASLAAAGFDQPDIYVDGESNAVFDQLPGYTYRFRGDNIRSYSHWYLTLQEMFLRDPWCQYYAIFQDDFVCVSNLRAYLSKCQYPEKGYWNLFTFMENDVMVQEAQKKGWMPAARAPQGYQLGRGAVALVFSHTAVQVLLNSPHMKTRMYDSQKGFKSIDGAVVTAMHHAGWTEYVHNPSLVQHIGEESSMGNKKHPQSKCFDPEFNPLS